MISPRFEVAFTVEINDKGCYDIFSWAMDGFTVILSRDTTNYLTEGYGRELGFRDLQGAMVTKFDFFWDFTIGDKYWNFCVIRNCMNTRCKPDEDDRAPQWELPVVILLCKILALFKM